MVAILEIADDGRAFYERRVRKWLLLDGNRALVVGLVSLAFFVLLVAVTVSWIAPLEDLQPTYYLLGALIGGNITIVTVVVAINQLVLSRELNRPGELQAQIQGIVDYRSDVGEEAGGVPPADPRGFLRVLVENVREQATELRSLTEDNTGEAIATDVDEIVTPVVDHLDRIETLLEASETSTFEVLSATLATDYAREITWLKQIEVGEGKRMPPVDTEAIDELVERLEEINVAQQYFKTIYLQQELAALSRHLFYVGLPAIAVLVIGIQLLTTPGGAAVSESSFAVLLPAIVTVGLLPLFVLFAYILRIATVAERTAATAPFTTPTEEN